MFTQEIVPKTVEPLIQALAKLSQEGVQEVYMAFSTPGGNVAQGITLYNFLRGGSFKLIVHNIGNIDSIGNAIFLAADTRYACAHSTFMFHGVAFNTTEASSFESKRLREMLDTIGADQRRIGGIITERTNISQDDVDELFLEAQTKTAELALERRIVHEIREFKLPLRAPVISFVFQR